MDARRDAEDRPERGRARRARPVPGRLREFATTYDLPTLLCWGRDEKLIKASNADWLAANQKNATVAWFENSGHCPMWEEADKFNQVVGDFIAGLPA